MNQNLTFVPIPLATGDTLAHPDTGRDARVAAISLTVTLTDGTAVAIPLQQQSTGWWAPPQASAHADN